MVGQYSSSTLPNPSNFPTEPNNIPALLTLIPKMESAGFLEMFLSNKTKRARLTHRPDDEGSKLL
jgi:hypothetical protein